jgi:hypothetical protein
MTYPADYTIADSHFLFNSYAFKAFSRRRGLELSELLKIVAKTVTKPEDETEEMKLVKGFTEDDATDVLLAGHQSWCLYNKQEFKADEATANTWIDQLGGYQAGRDEIVKLYIVFACRLFNLDPSGQTEAVQEKKSVEAVQEKVTSPGETSM